MVTGCRTGHREAGSGETICALARRAPSSEDRGPAPASASPVTRRLRFAEAPPAPASASAASIKRQPAAVTWFGCSENRPVRQLLDKMVFVYNALLIPEYGYSPAFHGVSSGISIALRQERFRRRTFSTRPQQKCSA